MLEFLHQGWWPIFLGLLIPLMIHLWNRKEGLTIRVGSIKWIPETEEHRMSSLQFSEFWRFLVRSFLLLFLILLVLELVWTEQKEEQHSLKWLLLEQEAKPTAALLQTLDSLANKGYEIHSFEKDFPLWDEKGNQHLSSEDYWRLLEVLATNPHPPDTVLLLATPLQRKLQGKRPNLPFVLEWKPLPVEEKTKPFLAKAWKLNAEEAMILIGHAGTAQISFSQHQIDLLSSNQLVLADSIPPLQVESGISPASWSIRLKEQNQVIEEKPIIKVGFVSAITTSDRFYLEAALDAIASYTNIGIDVKDQVDEVDILFQFREKEAYSNRLFEKRDTIIQVSEHLNLGNSSSGNLVNELLPLVLESILPSDLNKYDQRFVSVELAQVQEQKRKSSNFVTKASTETNWNYLWWILLLGLFLVDRFWDFRISQF